MQTPYENSLIFASNLARDDGGVGDDSVVQEAQVLALIGLVLLVLWLLGFIAFHVSSGVIHILLVLAVISIIMHFLRGRTVA